MRWRCWTGSPPGAAVPSASDLDDLRGWAGWGPMAPAFSPHRKDAWREIGERLEWLLPPEQLPGSRAGHPERVLHPTRPRRRMLARSCAAWASTAAGSWNPGAARACSWPPTPAGSEVTWMGVERDPVTARIAQLLHPAARIINERLQNAALPAHSVDAVIGNVPFGETPVYDPTAPKEVTKSLHNYCIWRSARTLRPGGVAVLITSRYTMDARDTGARQAIAAEADLIGAIRLPNDALSPGGTEVVTDILVLRRRDGASPPADADWIETVQLYEVNPEERVELRRPAQPVVRRSSRRGARRAPP